MSGIAALDLMQSANNAACSAVDLSDRKVYKAVRCIHIVRALYAYRKDDMGEE